MTELQLGLIVLGVFAVCGVLIYNKWQERRHRALAEQVLGSAHQDVLLDSSPQGGASARAPYAAEPGGDPAPVDDVPDRDTPTDERSGPVGRLAERFAFGRQKPSDKEDDVEAPATEAGGCERIEPVLGGIEPALPGRVEPEWTPAPSIEESMPEAREAQPHFVSASASASAVPMPPVPSIPPAAAEIASGSAAPGSSPVPVEPGAEVRNEARRESGVGITLSPLIDYVASFEAVESTSGRKIFERPREALGRVKKFVQCIGFNESTHEWEKIDEDNEGEYRRFRFGLQLVDRQGPASESDLSVFCVAMQDLADATLSIVDLPQRMQAMKAAADLDAFCAGVDIQIGINVVSQAQAFQGTKLRALAEAAGMTMDIEGRFVRCDEDGHVLYVLVNQEAQPFAPETMRGLSTHALTFLLDVPSVAHGDRVFNQMVDLAKRFADVLRGTVVDDNRRPLSESALDPIRKQIGHYQALLGASHLPAGSELTRRLFS